jgi:hypothetical protein
MGTVTYLKLMYVRRQICILAVWLIKKIPGGGKTFHTRPDQPWGPPSILYNGYRVFPGGKVAGAWC